jgi:hypothetical protein
MKTSQRPSSQKKISYGSKKLSPPIPLRGLHLLVRLCMCIYVCTTRRMRRGVGCRVFVYVCIRINEYASSPLADYYLARYSVQPYIHLEPLPYNSIL